MASLNKSWEWLLNKIKSTDVEWHIGVTDHIESFGKVQMYDDPEWIKLAKGFHETKRLWCEGGSSGIWTRDLSHPKRESYA